MAVKMCEAHRIIKKYPDHVPVICMKEDKSDKRKLLVPVQMKGCEIIATAQDRCSWASAQSSLLVDGKPLESEQTASQIYADHQAKDGFLYVLVTEAAVSEKVSEQQEWQLGSAQPVESSGGSSPPIFHMPDNEQPTLSADAKRARKVLKKYPDRVPVLVKQAATIGLPEIDKKLLVPRTMTCAGLQAILPKHLGIPKEENVKWDKLRISMGEIPLQETAVMSDVYSQYVDDNDGILNVTLWIDMPGLSGSSADVEVPAHMDEQLEEAAAWSSWRGPSPEEAKEAQKLLDEAKKELEKAAQEAACAKARAETAEGSAVAEAERAMAAEAKALNAEEQLAHMGQAFLAEKDRAAQLQAALSAAEDKIKAFEEARVLAGSELVSVRQQLAAHSQEKSQEVETLQQTLRAAELSRVQAEEKQALGAERAKAAEAALQAKVQHQLERADLAEKAKDAALEVARAEAARASSSEQNYQEESKKLREELRLLTDRLAEEKAEKAAAQDEARSLGDRLSALQLAETERVAEKKKREAKRLADEEANRKKEQEQIDGFVHLSWDRDGFAVEVEEADNEFELLVSDEA